MLTLREMPTGNGMKESVIQERSGLGGEKPLPREEGEARNPCPLLNNV